MSCLKANDDTAFVQVREYFLLRQMTQCSGFHSRLNNAWGAPAHDIIWSTFRTTGTERKVSTFCGLTHMQILFFSFFVITYAFELNFEYSLKKKKKGWLLFFLSTYCAAKAERRRVAPLSIADHLLSKSLESGRETRFPRWEHQVNRTHFRPPKWFSLSVCPTRSMTLA